LLLYHALRLIYRSYFQLHRNTRVGKRREKVATTRCSG